MNTITYNSLPPQAKSIRIKIFMEEQGFENEFDEIDQTCKHIVCFDKDKAIGTCRFFKEDNHYTIGRVAVLMEYRKKHIGTLLVQTAEKEIKSLGGNTIVLHAQERVTLFYEKQGYKQYGEIDYDEGCPHKWMKKEV